MKKLILASLAVAATLASCQKTSVVDPTLTTDQEMTFAPYAGASATKGSAVNSNGDLAGNETDGYGSFYVASYLGTDSYFGFRKVTYNGTAWENQADMYWPNESATLHFGAYYPAAAVESTDVTYSYDADDANSLSFDYTVEEDVADQIDLMYAITDYEFTSSTDAGSEDAVGLHFKHALTQIGFTATKDDDIAVEVSSIKICNVVDNGTFKATAATNYDASSDEIDTDQDESEVNTTNFGTWTPATANTAASVTAGTNTATNLQNYTAVMADFETDASAITVAAGTDATQLTSTTDVMMLLPQTLEAWNATDDTDSDGTESYLAIKCKITHSDGTAAIVDGTIYVPFSTAGIEYTSGTETDGWKAGYKITYNLNFGGGYTIPDDDDPETPDPTDPEPGETPEPDDVVPTLRDITYTVTVDEWIPVEGGTVSM